MMDRGKCPKHVEYYSKNKFEKLVHLVGFIIRIFQDVPSSERQILYDSDNGASRLRSCGCMNYHPAIHVLNSEKSDKTLRVVQIIGSYTQACF